MPRWRPVWTGAVALLALGPGLAGGTVSDASSPPPAPVVAQYRMPNGWLLRPAGRQVVTPKAPTGVAVSPDSATVVAVTSGLADEHLVTVSAATLAPALTPVNAAFVGVAVGPTGGVYAAGGSSDRVYPFQSVAGAGSLPTAPLLPVPGVPVGGIPVGGYPAGMALARDGRLYVAGSMSGPHAGCAAGPVCSQVSVLDTTGTPPTLTGAVPVGRDAYALALDEPAHRLFVTNWADATVSVLDVGRRGAEHVVATVPVGSQPTGIAVAPDHRYVAVTGSNDDSLTMLRLDRSGNVQASRRFSLRVAPDLPRGAEPMAAGYGPDGTLYVAEGGLNAVEVRTEDGRPRPQRVRLASGGRTHTEWVPHTWIPTGWFPDALALAPDGRRLYVANLKGMGSGPGVYEDVEPLTGTRTEGSLSAVDLPAASERERAYATWTSLVVDNDRLAPVFAGYAGDPAVDPCRGAPQPDGTAATSQLLCDAATGALDPRALHVVYVVNENKTFDSYFGDIGPALPGADASPAYAQYGSSVTPNQHAIARAWNLSDNFWSDGDVSSEGHQWLTAGYETPHDELLWGPEYDEGLRGSRSGGEYAGQLGGASSRQSAAVEAGLENPRRRIFDEIADPAANPLGISQRIYSDDVRPGSPAAADQVPLSLWGLGPHAVSGKDVTFPDVDRAQLFLHGSTVSHAWNAVAGPPPASFGKAISFSGADQAKFSLDGWSAAYRSCRAAGGADSACQRAMPNFSYLVFPENHTYVVDNGLNPLDPTPQSMVADNDAAMGQLVAGLSRSPFWANTLFLLTQDDVQYVGDHVDVHRDFLLAAGGLARQLGPSGQAAHQTASFPSMLKTVEVLFHLPALTLFDARAVPLDDVLVARSTDRSATSFDPSRPLTPFLGDGGGFPAR